MAAIAVGCSVGCSLAGVQLTGAGAGVVVVVVVGGVVVVVVGAVVVVVVGAVVVVVVVVVGGGLFGGEPKVICNEWFVASMFCG
jgi:hypothetical protein